MRTSNTQYASLGRLAGLKNRGHLMNYEADWFENPDENPESLTKPSLEDEIF